MQENSTCRHALLTVNAVARFNIAALPRDALYAVILPALYTETTVREELKREIDYAAFKLIVDGSWTCAAAEGGGDLGGAGGSGRGPDFG